MIFYDTHHQQFFYKMLKENSIHPQDNNRRAMFYLLGLSDITRKHSKKIYNNRIYPNCIHAPWQTSTTKKITRLALGLFSDITVTAVYIDDPNDVLEEYSCNRISNIFNCTYAPYFFEAIKIRYPDYTC